MNPETAERLEWLMAEAYDYDADDADAARRAAIGRHLNAAAHLLSHGWAADAEQVAQLAIRILEGN